MDQYSATPYRDALKQYKESYKILFGLELTSISIKEKEFEAFLKEVLGGIAGVSIVTTTFSVDNVAILKTAGSQ